jgi:hypothetical protein
MILYITYLFIRLIVIMFDANQINHMKLNKKKNWKL